MEQKKSSKKRLLFILLPVLAVLLAGGLIVGLNAKNWFGPRETVPEETGTPTESETEPASEGDEKLPVAYNLDFEYYSGMTEGGLSSRPKQDDGLFHIMVSIEGVQRELLTDKYSLVNVIDSREFSCILYDEDRMITGVKKIEDCGYTLLLESGYMQKYDKEAGVIRANIDENMAGFAVTIPISAGIPIYDTMNQIDPAPEADLKIGDHLGVLRYDPENRLEVVVFPARVPVLDRFYWNVERNWSTDIQNTKRLPDENGDYVFTVYHNGEETVLKTKILEIAKTIDSYAFKCFAARMNKEGYVVHVTRCQDALSGRSAASWYNITQFENDDHTEFTARKYSGADKDSVATVEIAENCRIFNVGGPFDDHGGEYTTLEIGDQVHCILNANGLAEAIFVVSRRIESRVYWNVSRQYDSNAKSTTRTPDASGMYSYLMAVDGKQITLKAKNKEIADKIDSIAAKHMGLSLEGDVITAVHTTAGNKVRGYFGSAASWYNIEKFTDASGKEFVAKKYGSGSDAGTTVTLKVSDDCVMYNVSSRYTSFVGEPTKILVGDQIHCLVNGDGEASFIYVVNRYYQSQIYWNVERKYDTTKKETTRKPNAEGYYEFLMATNGKQVTLQTKDKAIANQIDAFAARNMGLLLAADGKTITKYIHYASVEGYTGGSSSSWCDVLSISGSKFTTQKLTDPTNADYMKVFNETKAANCKVYNCSGFYDGASAEGHFVGEETTLRVGDRVHVLTDRNKKAVIVFVVARSYPVTAHKDKHVCYDCGKEVEWTPWTKAASLPTATGHYYLCGNVTLTAQQNLEKGANVVLCLNGYTVTGSDEKRIFNGVGENAKLTVIGEQKGSKVVAGKYQDPEGDVAGLIAFTRNANMFFYGGTYDASNVKTPANASGFFNASGHRMELHNLTVIGGEAGKFGGVLSVNTGSEVLLDNVTFKGGKGKNRNEIVGVSAGTLTLKGKITFEGLEEGITGLYFNGGKATLDGLTGGSIPVKSSSAGAFTTNYEEGAEAFFTSTDPAYIVGIGDGSALVLATSKATAVEPGETSVSLRKQQKKALSVTVTPSDAATTALTYESSDPSVVTVDEDGNLTAGTKEGTATVTVKTKDGAAEATLTVTVAGDPVAVTGITPAKTAIELSLGASEKLEYTIDPPEAAYQVPLFASDNEKVATVDADGNVKAVGAGSTTIRLSAEYGNAAASVTVTVTAHDHCVCGDGALTAGGHTHGAPNWIPWTSADSLPTGADANGKAYYLTSDVKLSQSQLFTGVDVTICLNGYTVSSTVTKTLYAKEGSVLTITDCSGKGAVRVTGSFSGSGVAGCVVSLSESTLNLYGGTLDASACTTSYGSVVYTDKNDTINMYGGTMKGGSATLGGGSVYLAGAGVINMYGGTIEGGHSDTTGGNLYVASASRFYGGTVKDGTATTYGGNVYLYRYETEFSGTTFENGSARSGGNVYLTVNASLTINGSTLTGGKATQSGSSGGIGGNICTNGLTTMNDGTISNGQSFGSQPAGNVGVWDTGSKFVMNGGTITGGKAEGSSAGGGVAVFYHAAEGAFVMNGGTITGNEGGVYIKTGDITISGNAVIDGNTGSNLTAAGSAIKLGGALETGAKIGVSVSAADTFAASETDYSANFSSDDEKYNVVWDSEAKAHKLTRDNSNVKLDIYILSGQSNANGSSTFASAKDGERDANSYENVKYYTLRNYVDGTQGDYHPDYQPVKEGLGSTGTTIGPELGMAQILNPLYEGDDKEALILKYAAGGTSLIRHKLDDGTLSPGASGTSLDMYNQKGTWYPTELETAQSKADGENRNTGFLYRGLLNSIETVYNELLSMGYKAENITFKTFDWMQGESDRDNPAVYKDVFPAFIAGVRAKVSAVTGQDYSKLPVVVGEISETFGAATPERIAVCRAFIAMQNSLPGVVSDLTVIPTSQFQINGYDSEGNAVVLGSDASHWSYGDALKVGRMFAEATVGSAEPETPHTHCICGAGEVTANGHSHADLTWQKWSYAYGLPTSAGNWYLTTDVSISGTLNLEGVTGVNICLNGHTVTANCNRPLFVKAASSLTMTNCQSEGKYENVMTSALANGGGLFSIDGGSTVTVYNTTLDASKVTCKYGSAVYMNKNTDALNIYNSEVIAGKATVSGGAMYLAGNLTVYDSVIRDGSAPEGGNLYVTGNATATLGGTTKVTGGKATTGGGNISAAGTGRKLILKDQVEVSGGIADNEASSDRNGSGGNLYLRGGSQTTIQDEVLVKGGRSYGMGGNICVVKDTTAKVTMTGGTVTEGVSVNNGGGNVVVYQGGTFTIEGGTVSKGWAKSNGYNIRVGGTLNIGGTALITTRGVYNGTTTSNNAVSTNDGDAPVINMTGGTIAENLQSVKDTAVITVKGGRVAGNVNAYTGVVNLQGGYVGGALSKNSGTLTISGGYYVNDPTSFLGSGRTATPGTYSNEDTADTTEYKYKVE